MLQRQDRVQQGSRLTAFELKHDGIDVSLIPDTAVGYTMANGLVDGVIVGADRISAKRPCIQQNWNISSSHHGKTTQYSILCRSTTINILILKVILRMLVIEQRKASEVTGIGDTKTAPDGIDVINPCL